MSIWRGKASGQTPQQQVITLQVTATEAEARETEQHLQAMLGKLSAEDIRRIRKAFDGQWANDIRKKLYQIT